MTDFSDHADCYEQEIASAVSFFGRDASFFVELKADLLVGLIRRRWGDPARARVLDVGCGPGGMDSHLVERVGHLHGVDTSEQMVARARRRNRSAVYDVCGPERLPFDDMSFDVAFASCVLHHVPPQNRMAFVSELRRVVRPGGLVAVYEHNPINPLTRLVVSRCAFDADAILLGKKQTMRLLEEQGLRGTHAAYILFFVWRGRVLRVAESAMRRLPAGAQYVVTARRAEGPANFATPRTSA